MSSTCKSCQNEKDTKTASTTADILKPSTAYNRKLSFPADILKLSTSITADILKSSLADIIKLSTSTANILKFQRADNMKPSST